MQWLAPVPLCHSRFCFRTEVVTKMCILVRELEQAASAEAPRTAVAVASRCRALPVRPSSAPATRLVAAAPWAGSAKRIRSRWPRQETWGREALTRALSGLVPRWPT